MNLQQAITAFTELRDNLSDELRYYTREGTMKTQLSSIIKDYHALIRTYFGDRYRSIASVLETTVGSADNKRLCLERHIQFIDQTLLMELKARIKSESTTDVDQTLLSLRAQLEGIENKVRALEGKVKLPKIQVSEMSKYQKQTRDFERQEIEDIKLHNDLIEAERRKLIRRFEEIQDQIEKLKKQDIDRAGTHTSRIPHLPLISLTPNQVHWLKETWRTLLTTANNPSYKAIRLSTLGETGEDFDPSTIDQRLLKEKSTQITLLGVLHIERETTILDDIDRVILAIRKRLLTDTSVEDFMIGDVAEELGLEKSYTQIIFSLASMYGNFWNGASSTSAINSPFGYERFSITNESTFDSYIKFKSIAEIIDDYYKKQGEYDRKLSRSILDSKSQDFEVEQPGKPEPFFAEISKDTRGTIKKDMMTIIIFYSWQSDVRYNRKAILDALRQAISEVERKIPGVHLKIDEAISNETGSPHIPNSILQNIAKSDIFIGDLSIVGKAYASEKKLPNPNVSLELGYAISELTWSRIILLFNKNFGSFPGDLPFDIEKRRCVDFAVAIEKDTNGIGQLRTELIARISEIITNNPRRNILSRNQVGIHQREKDIKTLESILNLLRLKMMDHLFKDGYSSIYSEVPKKIKALNELMDGKLFFLFNEDARQRVHDLRTKLNVIARLVETDYKRNRYDSVTYEHKERKNIGTPNRFDEAKQKLIELDEAFTTFLNYVRINYHEINIDAFYEYEDDE